MTKTPILLLGGAVVVVAIVATRKSDSAVSSVQPAAAPPRPQTRSLQSMTQTQKTKLENWARSKGVPVDKAYDIAKSLFQAEF